MRWTQSTTFVKDPGDTVDYIMDFTPLLQSDSIDSATVTGTNITIASSSVSANVVTIFVSGGSSSTTATVKVVIVTTNATPRTYERSFKIQIKDL